MILKPIRNWGYLLRSCPKLRRRKQQMIRRQSEKVMTEICIRKASLAMLIGKLRKSEAGQTLTEYVMVLALIALSVFMASPTITSAFVGVFMQTSSVLVSY